MEGRPTAGLGLTLAGGVLASVTALAAVGGSVPAMLFPLGPALVALPLVRAMQRADGERAAVSAPLMLAAWVVVCAAGAHPRTSTLAAVAACAVTTVALVSSAGTKLPQVVRMRAAVDAVTVAVSTCLAGFLLWDGPLHAGVSPGLFFLVLAAGSVAFAVCITLWAQAFHTRTARTSRLALAAAAMVLGGLAESIGPDVEAIRGLGATGVTLGMLLWRTARQLPVPGRDSVVLGSRPVEVWVLSLAVGLAGVSLAVSGALLALGGPPAVVTLALGFLLLLRLHVDQREEAQMAAAAAHQQEAQIEELRQREERFRSLVAHSSDIVTLLDAGGLIRYQSNSIDRILGWQPDVLVGRTVESFVHADDHARLLALLDPSELASGQTASVELRFLRPDGSTCEVETTVSNLLGNPAVQGIVLTSRDMTVRKQLEDQLRRRAFHDALTGVGNRVLFRDRIDHAINRIRRYGGSLAVLFLDLDGFKQVNDTLGHDTGDQLLIAIAARLRESLRTTDTLARMGGDEFAILLEHPEDVRDIQAVARRLVGAVQMPVTAEGNELRVGCSVGVDVATCTGAPTADALIRNADLAMYKAKSLGTGRVVLFEPELREAALGRAKLEADLRVAVDDAQLVLHFQPVVSLPDGAITGVEALVRWDHPELGLVQPGEFIGVAEESDLIIEIGRWTLTSACAAIAALELPTRVTPPWVAVNVAGRQLARPGLEQAVTSALKRSGLEPRRLVLEITEGSLIEEPEARHLLRRLRALGVRIAIDDFGTGYSSLSRLRNLPVDRLKIDKSFVQEIQSANDEVPIIAAVMAMVHGLGLTAVAEGVETVAQLASLHAHGCEEAQGFLMSRPVAVAQLAGVLANPDGLIGAALAAGPLVPVPLAPVPLTPVPPSPDAEATPVAQPARVVVERIVSDSVPVTESPAPTVPSGSSVRA